MNAAPFGDSHVGAAEVRSKQCGEGGEVCVIHTGIMEILHLQSMEILHQMETKNFHITQLVPQAVTVQFYTMYEAGEILAIIEARRAELGLSQIDVSLRAFGKADNSAIQSLKKGSSPSIERVAALAGALGLELYLGPIRDTAEAVREATSSEFAHVPLHAAKLAAGHGIANVAEDVIEYLAFRRDWLRRLGVAPSNAVLARASGDSMLPCVSDGDMVLIDRSKTEVPVRSQTAKRGRSPVYAFLDDGQARIKRIERPDDGQVILLSDNPEYPPEFAKIENLSIIGKVLWWGHTNRD